MNIETGEFTNFDQTNTPWEEAAWAAKASSSIPAVFPPHHWPGRGYFMDGGTVWNINVEAAVDQCLEIVDDESKITIDIAICSTVPQESYKITKNAAKNYLRA